MADSNGCSSCFRHQGRSVSLVNCSSWKTVSNNTVVYSDHYIADKILGRNIFCSAGRLLKVNAGFWWGWGITWNVLEPSSRTVTEQTQLPAPCSGRWWHFFNLLSNHVLFKQNPVLSHFVLKFICRFACLNPLSLFRKWRGARGLCRGLRSALTSRVCIVWGQLCAVLLASYRRRHVGCGWLRAALAACWRFFVTHRSEGVVLPTHLLSHLWCWTRLAQSSPDWLVALILPHAVRYSGPRPGGLHLWCPECLSR